MDGRPCGFCGDPTFMEVVEFWPEERAFMFDTCCEDLQNGLIAALQDAMTLPFQQRTAYLKEIRAAFSLDGLPFRQVYDEWPGGGLRLDLGLSTPPSVVDAPISPIPFRRSDGLYRGTPRTQRTFAGMEMGSRSV